MACPSLYELVYRQTTADEWGENQRQITIVVDVEESSLKLFLAGKPCIFATVFNISIATIFTLKIQPRGMGIDHAYLVIKMVNDYHAQLVIKCL